MENPMEVENLDLTDVEDLEEMEKMELADAVDLEANGEWKVMYYQLLVVAIMVA